MYSANPPPVYGIEECSAVETMPTGCTINPYGWTKLMNEQILIRSKRLTATFLSSFNRFQSIGADESGRIGENPNGIENNLMPYITQVAAGRLKRLGVFGNDYPTHDGQA